MVHISNINLSKRRNSVDEDTKEQIIKTWGLHETSWCNTVNCLGENGLYCFTLDLLQCPIRISKLSTVERKNQGINH